MVRQLRSTGEDSLMRPILLGNYWLMLVLAGGLFVLVAAFVDLTPVVDQNFFFSTMILGSSKPKRSSKVFRRIQK